MARISVDFDTKTKQLDVTVNGERLNNVTHVSVWRGHDEEDHQKFIEISVETAEVDVDEELAKRVVFVSHGSAQGKKAVAEGNYVEHPQLPGMVGVVIRDPVLGEVADYLGQKLGTS